MVLRICNSLKYHGSPLHTILLGKLAGLAVSAVLSSSHSVPFHGSQKDGQPGPFRANCSSIMFNWHANFYGICIPSEKLHVSAFRLSLVRFPRPCLETVSHSAWPIVDEWPTAGHHLTMADIEDLKLPGASGPGRGAQIGVEIEIHKETPGESKVAGDSLKKETSPNLVFQLTSSSIGSFLNCGIFNFKTMNFNANICWNDLTTQFIKQQHISGHLQSDIVVFVHHPMLTPKTWHVTTVTTRWGWNVVISPQPLGETWATGGHRLHLFHGKIQGKPWENPP